MVEAVEFRSVGCGALHLPPDPHIEGKRGAHHYGRTDSQYEEPPEHPHNPFRIADGRRQKSVQNEERSVYAQPFFAGLAIALRRFSTFFETRSNRLRASFDPVATFSIFAYASGLFIFSRSSFRKG